MKIIYTAILTLTTLILASCSSNQKENYLSNTLPLVVTTSAITADLAKKIGGNGIDVRLLVPNGFDSHTYEPKPSEITLLGNADLIVVPDINLNPIITGLVQLSGSPARILDLNAAALNKTDLIYNEKNNQSSYNPHTWTSPILGIKWLEPLTERILLLDGVNQELIAFNSKKLLDDLLTLDSDIRKELNTLAEEERKLVVYHDAWVYFGLEYGLQVVGAIQAASFAEPSAAELSKMVDQIRQEKVKAFFGSEVFPSDVLNALEQETGAKYIANLSDDKLPGLDGELKHSYIGMMRENLAIIMDGLKK